MPSTPSRPWLITLIEKLPKDFLPNPTYVSTHEVFFMKIHDLIQNRIIISVSSLVWQAQENKDMLRGTTESSVPHNFMSVNLGTHSLTLSLSL